MAAVVVSPVSKSEHRADRRRDGNDASADICAAVQQHVAGPPVITKCSFKTAVAVRKKPAKIFGLVKPAAIYCVMIITARRRRRSSAIYIYIYIGNGYFGRGGVGNTKTAERVTNRLPDGRITFSSCGTRAFVFAAFVNISPALIIHVPNLTQSLKGDPSIRK